MATFNQVLESQISPTRTAQGPSLVNFLAGAAETIGSTVSNFTQAVTENEADQKRKKVLGRVEELIRLEEDMVQSGEDGVKARKRLNDALRSSFPDDPEMQLTLRSQLAGYRGGYLSQQVKADTLSAQESEQRTAEELWSLIPPNEKVLLLGDVPMDGLSSKQKISLFQDYQKMVTKTKQATDSNNQILEKQTIQTVSDINSWHSNMMEARDAPLALATRNFFTSLQGIDLTAPGGVEQFQNAKLQARQSASLIEQDVRANYDLLINKINDPKLIDLAEKKRDSLLSVIESFVQDIEADSLDLLQVRGETFNALVRDEKLPFVQAIGQGQALRDVYGDATTAVMMQSLLQDSERRKQLTNRITGMFDVTFLKRVEDESDASGSYRNPEEWNLGYGSVREAAINRAGITDPKFSERLAKNFIKGANLAGFGGLAMEDVKLQLDDYAKMESHWAQLGEAEREMLKLSRDRLEQVYVLDPTDGVVSVLLGNGQAKFNAESMKLEYVQSAKPFEVRGGVPLPGFSQERVQERLQAEGKRQVQTANEQLKRVIAALKAENPGMTEQEIISAIPVLRK